MNHDIIGKVISTLGVKNLYPGLSAFSGVSKTDAAINQFKKGPDRGAREEVERHPGLLPAPEPRDLRQGGQPPRRPLPGEAPPDLRRPQVLLPLRAACGLQREAQGSGRRLEAFKQKHKLYSLDEQRGILLRQRMEADSADKDAENRIGELERKIASLKGQMRTVKKNVPVTSEEPALPRGRRRQRPASDPAHQGAGAPGEVQGGQQARGQRPEGDRRPRGLPQKQKENQTPKVITGKNPVYEEMEKEMVKAQADLASLESRKALPQGPDSAPSTRSSRTWTPGASSLPP